MSGKDIVNYFKNKYSSSDSSGSAKSNSMANDIKKSNNNADDDSKGQSMLPTENGTKKENIYSSERSTDIYNDKSSQKTDENEMSM